MQATLLLYSIVSGWYLQTLNLSAVVHDKVSWSHYSFFRSLMCIIICITLLLVQNNSLTLHHTLMCCNAILNMFIVSNILKKRSQFAISKMNSHKNKYIIRHGHHKKQPHIIFYSIEQSKRYGMELYAIYVCIQ